MNIQISPIAPAMHKEIVKLHLDAFQGYANVQLGRQYVSRFIEWFVEQPDSIGLMAVSSHDGRLLGYVCGAPEGYQARMNLALFPAAAIGVICNPAILLNWPAWHKVIQKVLMLFSRRSVSGAQGPAVMRLVSMAVAPVSRGAGVGRLLVESFGEIAATKGFDAIELSVFGRNSAACGLYERCGYETTREGGNGTLCYRKRLDVGVHASSGRPNSGVERARIASVYARRKLGAGPSRYTHFSRPHLFMLQQLEREILGILSDNGSKIGDIKVLDVGCGNGYFLRQLVQWGAEPKNLFGVDILEERINSAKLISPPDIGYACGNADSLGFDSGCFDVISVFTVFSSIMDVAVKKRIAAEVVRALKPEGYIIWYDFFYDNPSNPDVRGVRKAEIQDYFPDCEIKLKRITPAPPLVRRVLPRSHLGYALASVFPLLCTHFLGTIKRRNVR